MGDELQFFSFSDPIFFLHQNIFLPNLETIDLLRQPQNDQTNPYLPNQTCQTKPIKPNIPDQNFKTMATKSYLRN